MKRFVVPQVRIFESTILNGHEKSRGHDDGCQASHVDLSVKAPHLARLVTKLEMWIWKYQSPHCPVVERQCVGVSFWGRVTYLGRRGSDICFAEGNSPRWHGNNKKRCHDEKKDDSEDIANKMTASVVTDVTIRLFNGERRLTEAVSPVWKASLGRRHPWSDSSPYTTRKMSEMQRNTKWFRQACVESTDTFSTRKEEEGAV